MNRALRGIISKFKQLMECERCGLFFVDDETDELYFQVEEEGAEIRFPKHLGIAGSVCTSGVGILIPDAYKDSRFNQAVDKQTGFKTHNILCQPIKNIVGDVIAVVQMVNCAKEGGEASEASEPFGRRVFEPTTKLTHPIRLARLAQVSDRRTLTPLLSARLK